MVDIASQVPSSSVTITMDRVPESTVEYFLYPCLDGVSGGEQSIKEHVDDLIVQYSSHLAAYLADYIWHKQPFSLRSITNGSDCYLYGRTTFEDNIEDEYFILFLLRELTLHDPRLVVKVNDEDEEILLIETAQFLDKWAQDPRRTENRVYLNNGHMHLIAPSVKPTWTESEARNVPKEAARFIRNNPEKTRCSDAIQKCILKRINAYPHNIKGLQHRAHCYIPISIALLLQQNPKLISHAVRAFYFRTSEDHKSIIDAKHFSAENCVLSTVTFTRCLYAQLTSQEFKPDKRSKWPILNSDDSNYNAYINGFKVTAGFEILFSQYEKSKSDNLDSEDDDRGKQPLWTKFQTCLEKNGFFGNEPVGSKRHTERLQQSKTFFSNMFVDLDLIDHDFGIGKQICDFTRSVDTERELQKWKSLSLEEEDDDSWLHLNQSDLDALLAEKFGCPPESEMNLDEISKNIPETIKKFVFNEASGLKGAEAPRAAENGKSKLQSSKVEKAQSGEKDFANFVKEIQFLVGKTPNLNDFMDGDSSDSSNMGDYGSDDDDEESLEELVGAGQSPTGQCSTSSSNDEQSSSVSPEVKAYLKQMDSELSTTVMAKSFNRQCPTAQLDSDDDADDESSPVEGSNAEIDLNVLSNILESYSGEAEMSTSVGPATALFATMGTKLPDIERD